MNDRVSADVQGIRATGREPWLWLGVLALVSCLAHLVVDLRVGIYGSTSPALTGWDAWLAGLNALTIGMWAFALSLAASGNRTGFAAAAMFAVVHGTLGNGLISLFIAPPPSLGFPYQDITHFGSLIFGTLAALAAWKQMRRTPGRVRPLLPLFALLIMVPIGYVSGKVRTEHLPVEQGITREREMACELAAAQPMSTYDAGAGTIPSGNRARRRSAVTA